VPDHLPTGYYVEPTVLTGVDPDATVAQEEIFGPVLVVLPHDGVYYGADVPFGGYRQSGIGRESGVAGFEEYLEIKAIAEPA
jgi:aldehyde dehydrogenase (NAD+)